jgi:hypothetical protein
MTTQRVIIFVQARPDYVGMRLEPISFEGFATFHQ